MKYLAAYALVSLSEETPKKSAVEAVLKAAGVPIDSSRINTLFAEFGSKDFNAVCAEGKAKLVGGAARPGGAAAATTAAAPAAAAAAAPAAAAAEEEEDDDMGFGLFD